MGGPTPNLEAGGESGESGEMGEIPEPETEDEGGGEDQSTGGGSPLPDPSDEELKKYDLGMEDYSRNMDREEIDYSEES